MLFRIFAYPSSIENRLASTIPNVTALSNGNVNGNRTANHAGSRTTMPTDPNPNGDQQPASKPNPGSTYEFQDSLPRLPIPDLQSSCQKYLDSLRPLQTPKEHHETKVAVREFLK